MLLYTPRSDKPCTRLIKNIMDELELTIEEDITLFTDEEHVIVKEVNEEFTQRSNLKGLTYVFTIFNDIQCYQFAQSKHGGKKKFRVNLTYLDPKPIRRFKLAENWLISAAIFSIISLMLIYLVKTSKGPFDSSLLITLSILSVTVTLSSFLIALFKSEDRMIFYSQYGRAPILEMMNKNPDKKAFSKFMHSLSQHIISAQTAAGLDKTTRLVQELKEVRRLKDESVITEGKYERAKKLIFRNKAFKS